jgi:hypothetical protein
MTLGSTPKALRMNCAGCDLSDLTEVRGAPRTVTLAQKLGLLQPFIVRGLICQNDVTAHELYGG